jgi:methylated-DNA-[protein]-cysteine S-methyltransferase
VEHLYTHQYRAPVGHLYLAVDRVGTVHRVSFSDFRPFLPADRWSVNKYVCGELEYQLDEYFAGSRRHFTLNVALEGTEFQLAVWKRLQKVGYGQTISYSSLAQKIGRRQAARAVGRAVALNPTVIVVPCHRVIHTDGSIGKYALHAIGADQGQTVKAELLQLEGRTV